MFASYRFSVRIFGSWFVDQMKQSFNNYLIDRKLVSNYYQLILGWILFQVEITHIWGFQILKCQNFQLFYIFHYSSFLEIGLLVGQKEPKLIKL